VLHVFGRLDRGGAETRFVELLHCLPAGEFAVDVCALLDGAGQLDGHVRMYGGDVIQMPLGARLPARFLALLRRQRYDVVHSHVLHTSGPLLMLAAMAGVPIRIAHFHATHDGRLDSFGRHLRRKLMCSLISRFATEIIACGEGSMDAVWQPGWRHDPRCQVVYDALDPHRFDRPVNRAEVRAELGVDANAPMFIHVGNVVAEKNHPRLLEIFAAIHALVPSSVLVLAGLHTAAPQGIVAEAISARGLERAVRRLGPRDDVPRLLKASDALLLPSIREGLPGIVLEACAAGLPVLSTDLPGVREIACRLAGVRYLPLTAADDEWARLALWVAGHPRPTSLDETAARRFSSSVFHIDRAVEAHRALWLGLQRGSVGCS
jgi:glycosyltransferase involved in cell wall biosynthesis